MSEQKYYVKVKLLTDYDAFSVDSSYYDESLYLCYENEYSKILKLTVYGLKATFTKSELAKIMDGVLYRTFAHQFDPELAEELYKLGYRTTQTTEEWIEARYEFDNIWEWINPLIELVPVDEV